MAFPLGAALRALRARACRRGAGATTAATGALLGTGAVLAAAALPGIGPLRKSHQIALAEEVPTRLAALHVLLVDLARIPEARVAGSVLPALLESFWQELARARLPVGAAENLLHRLAGTYGHGTLRQAHAARLAYLLGELGVHSVVDPLAHTGFHAHLLTLTGLHVEATDSFPGAICWSEVGAREVSDVLWEHCGDGWALFLSWVPHWNEAGFEALRGYQGDVLVLLGDDGDWTGTRAFHDELETNWTLIQEWATDSPWPRVNEKLRILSRRRSRGDPV